MSAAIRNNIDLVLLATGLFVGLVTPISILSRSVSGGIPTTDLIQIIANRPLIGVPSVLFAIAGFTFVSVSLNGFRGKYATAQERLEATTTTAIVATIICVVAFSLVFACSKVSDLVQYQDIRIFATIIGALVGFQFSASLPSVGDDRTPVVFTGAGGLLGYFAAPAFLFFITLAAVIFFAVPFLGVVFQRFSSQRQAVSAPTQQLLAGKPDVSVHDSQSSSAVVWL